jgi:hypothetical protein
MERLMEDVIEFGGHFYGLGNEITQSDPLAQRGDKTWGIGLKNEVIRLNRAFIRYKMEFLRDNQEYFNPTIERESKLMPQSTANESYAIQMFEADSLRPQGLEKLNMYPLTEHLDDQRAAGYQGPLQIDRPDDRPLPGKPLAGAPHYGPNLRFVDYKAKYTPNDNCTGMVDSTGKFPCMDATWRTGFSDPTFIGGSGIPVGHEQARQERALPFTRLGKMNNSSVHPSNHNLTPQNVCGEQTYRGIPVNNTCRSLLSSGINSNTKTDNRKMPSPAKGCSAEGFCNSEIQKQLGVSEGQYALPCKTPMPCYSVMPPQPYRGVPVRRNKEGKCVLPEAKSEKTMYAVANKPCNNSKESFNNSKKSKEAFASSEALQPSQAKCVGQSYAISPDGTSAGTFPAGPIMPPLYFSSEKRGSHMTVGDYRSWGGGDLLHADMNTCQAQSGSAYCRIPPYISTMQQCDMELKNRYGLGSNGDCDSIDGCADYNCQKCNSADQYCNQFRESVNDFIKNNRTTFMGLPPGEGSRFQRYEKIPIWQQYGYRWYERDIDDTLSYGTIEDDNIVRRMDMEPLRVRAYSEQNVAGLAPATWNTKAPGEVVGGARYVNGNRRYGATSYSR